MDSWVTRKAKKGFYIQPLFFRLLQPHILFVFSYSRPFLSDLFNCPSLPSLSLYIPPLFSPLSISNAIHKLYLFVIYKIVLRFVKKPIFRGILLLFLVLVFSLSSVCVYISISVCIGSEIHQKNRFFILFLCVFVYAEMNKLRLSGEGKTGFWC